MTGLPAPSMMILAPRGSPTAKDWVLVTLTAGPQVIPPSVELV
jgi:hypothetical protein